MIGIIIGLIIGIVIFNMLTPKSYRRDYEKRPDSYEKDGYVYLLMARSDKKPSEWEYRKAFKKETT